MRKERAFSILELLIVIIIIGILASGAFLYYQNVILRAKGTEAVSTSGDIRRAQEVAKLSNGAFQAADNTAQVNENLGLDINSKEFDYKIVDVTDDNYKIIAEEKEKKIIIAMDRSGNIETTYGEYSGGGSGSGGGGSGGGGSGGSGGGGGGSYGGGGSGGGSSGGSAGGSSGGGSGDSGTGGSGGSSGGGGGEVGGAVGPTVGGDLQDAYTLLGNSQFGKEYFDLIVSKNITLTTGDLTLSGALAQYAPYWPKYFFSEDEYPGGNTITVNSETNNSYTREAVACLLIHEATHADFEYNQTEWVERAEQQLDVSRDEFTWWRYDDGSLVYHPVTSLPIWMDTIYQEQQAFINSVLLWKEIRGSQTNDQMDFWAGLYDQDPSGTLIHNAVVALYSPDPNNPFPEYFKEPG